MWWILGAVCCLIYAIYKTVKAGKTIDRFLADADADADAQTGKDDGINQKQA